MTYSILVEREEGGREREVREREGGIEGRMDVQVDSDCWGTCVCEVAKEGIEGGMEGEREEGGNNFLFSSL